MPVPNVTVPDMIRTYRSNRGNFYRTLLARLPGEHARERLRSAVDPTESPRDQAASESLTGLDNSDEFLAALGTTDVLKKPHHGQVLGRVTVTVDEALFRAEQIESVGAIFFAHLASRNLEQSDLFAVEADQRKLALARLLELRDALRYHRLG